MNSHYKGLDVAGAAYNDTQCRSEWFAKRARANHERRRAVVCVREVSHHHKSIVSTNTVLTNTVRQRPTHTARVRYQVVTVRLDRLRSWSASQTIRSGPEQQRQHLLLLYYLKGCASPADPHKGFYWAIIGRF